VEQGSRWGALGGCQVERLDDLVVRTWGACLEEVGRHANLVEGRMSMDQLMDNYLVSNGVEVHQPLEEDQADAFPLEVILEHQEDQLVHRFVIYQMEPFITIDTSITKGYY